MLKAAQTSLSHDLGLFLMMTFCLGHPILLGDEVKLNRLSR